MYHSIRTAVNISDVSKNECPIQPRTVLCSTCELNHYRVKLRHRAKHSIRTSAHGIYSRRELNFWLSIHQENNELVSNTSISNIPAEPKKTKRLHEATCIGLAAIVGVVGSVTTMSSPWERGARTARYVQVQIPLPDACQQPSSMRRY